MLEHEIARTEELIGMWSEALTSYEQQLLENPDHFLYRGQVNQTKDLLRELNQDLHELREEQARLTLQPHEPLPS